MSLRRSRIKDLPYSTRPQEKLLEKGKENLSYEELIALLLGTGSLKKNALRLAASITRQYPIATFSSLTSTQLTTIHGIGKTKASRLLAAIELGLRIFSQPSFTKTRITKTRDILTHVKDIAEKRQEYLITLYLNAREELLLKETVSVGNLNTIRVEPRSILAPAISTPSARIVLAHNHPSGDPTPSEDDVKFTVRIQEACRIMGVDLADHIIISPHAYFSFKEKNLVV